VLGCVRGCEGCEGATDQSVALFKGEQTATLAAANLSIETNETHGDCTMSVNTILLIVLVVILLGGGGFYFR